MDLGLAGAHVVVAGGTKGMGLAAAECFAEDGANVAVLARRQGPLDEALESLRALGSPDPIAIPTDLSSAASIEEAFATIGERWGGTVNSLVNVVGPGSQGNIEQLTDDEWSAAMEIGAWSAVRCVRSCLPMLRAAEWGRIVNVSAHSTKRQTAGLIAYTAAKAALTSISKNLSLHLAPEEILVNTVSPGTFLSEGLLRYIESLPPERNVDPTNLYDAMRAISEDFGHPAQMPRAGDPKEIGAVIAFVGSRRNSYMTGANINVDGGSDFT
ncbi:MAG TPA: SDR family oxidoreductase [Acidimicrobiia bacterium]|jgi:NAD(P)-dependent dehydrogenase (short-subunit alcohol dehydrogenase family)